MSFKRASYFNTAKVDGEDDILCKLTGRSDAIFIKNKYQVELNNANAAIVNMVHRLEENITSLKYEYDNSQRLKKNIDAHFEERNTLYQSLESLLSSEKSHEKEMWFETLKTRVSEIKDRHITVFQKSKDSDIESMNIGASLQYPTSYPSSQIQQRYEKILSDIESKEKEIRKEKERYYGEVASYNSHLASFEKDIQKTEDKFVAYDFILNTGTSKLQGCKYYGSLLYRMSSEKAKDEISLNTISHRVGQFKNTLGIIKKELSQYRGKMFVEMKY
jgi:hypothetical protein